jgi:hypothetical protein
MRTTAPDRRLVALIVVALAVAALAGCTGDHKARTGSPSGSAPATTTVQGYPGLYYDASTVSVVAGGPDELRLVGGVECAAMDAMLSAGQWRVVDRLRLPQASSGLATLTGIVPGLLLQRDSTLVFVALRGERQFCTATVTTVRRDGIAVTGTGLPGAAQGWAATTACTRTAPDALTVSVYFDTTAHVGGLVTAPLAGRDGGYRVDGAGADLNVLLLRHTSHLLEVFGSALTGGSPGEGVSLHELEAGDGFAGQVTVDAGSPDRPHGTFTMSGLVDPDSGGQVSLTVPFACPSVLVLKPAPARS